MPCIRAFWALHCTFEVLDGAAGRVFIHPASVNFSCGSFPSGWLVYTDIVETSKASGPSALGYKLPFMHVLEMEVRVQRRLPVCLMSGCLFAYKRAHGGGACVDA